MVVIDRYPSFAREGTICSGLRFYEPKEALFRKFVAAQRHRAREAAMRGGFPPKVEALSTSAARNVGTREP
jgi:hypothetical protein